MTPDEWLASNLPPTEPLPAAAMYNHDSTLVAKGKVYLDTKQQRGVFWATHGAKPKLPMQDALLTVGGKSIGIKEVTMCAAPLSAHWHFFLA